MKAQAIRLELDLAASRQQRRDILEIMESKLESRRQDEAAAVSEDVAAAEAKIAKDE